METLREIVQKKLDNRINTISSISRETKISEPTLRKIRNGKGFVSQAKLMELERLLDSMFE